MAKFMLILRDDPKGYADYSPEQFQRLIEKYRAWSQRLAAEGRVDLGRKLTDEGGRLMRKKDGKLSVKDGPFNETKEVVGGFYIIKADDYDHAVKLCNDHPAFLTGGSVEIRQVDFMGGPEE